MRVIVAHHFYRSASPSGENQAVEREVAEALAAGIDVQTHYTYGDDLADVDAGGWRSIRRAATVAGSAIASPAATRRLAQLIDDAPTDILHLHNPYPLISPAVIRTAAARGVRIVMTPHNYRMRCANGLEFRDGRLCSDCRHRAVPLPAVRHGCYQDSAVRTVPIAASIAIHRRTWHLVDRFIVGGPHVAEWLADIGIPRDRIDVALASAADPGEPSPPGSGAVFAGRLSHEKGVHLLLDAWRRSGAGVSGHTLTIVGDGPLRPVVDAAARLDPSIRPAGLRSKAGVAAAMRDSAVVVVPSECHETGPNVLVEALALGRPVIATRRGSMPASLRGGAGWIVDTDVAALADALRIVLGDRAALDAAGRIARARYLEERHPSKRLQLAEYYERVAATPRAVG